MHKRLTDHDAQHLMSGEIPPGRPDLADLAAAMSELRGSSWAAVAPQPSSELAQILNGRSAAPVSVREAEGAPISRPVAATAPASAVAKLTTGVRKMITWPSGLELPSKIALGAGLFAFAVSGVGAAGALPGPAQPAFDHLVATATDADDKADNSVPPTDVEEKKSFDNSIPGDTGKPTGDDAPSSPDVTVPKDPPPADKPAVVAPPADKPPVVAPPADKPKDPVPPPTDKPKDPVPPPTDKPKDPTPPPTETPKDPAAPPSDGSGSEPKP